MSVFPEHKQTGNINLMPTPAIRTKTKNSSTSEKLFPAIYFPLIEGFSVSIRAREFVIHPVRPIKITQYKLNQFILNWLNFFSQILILKFSFITFGCSMH